MPSNSEKQPAAQPDCVVSPYVAGRLIDDELVVAHQGATSIQITEHGDLIIEQIHGDPGRADDPHVIVIRAANVRDFSKSVVHFCKTALSQSKSDG